MRIDLSSIDRESFNVTERDGRILVVPRKTKFHWSEDELSLRSLLTTPDGTVLSSGFEKFFNLGENAEHDTAFYEALAEGGVEFTHKADGSLIIGDRIGGKAHFRTRGSHTLGEFHDRVMALIKETRIVEFLENDPLGEFCSFLFEYTSPENRIVVGYEVPELTFLGLVMKSNLRAILQWDLLQGWAEEMRVPVIQTYNLPSDLEDLLSVVRQWRDREGVVARFRHRERWMLLKLKSDWYLSLHALRFRLSDRRLRKFCFLQEIFSREQFVEELSRMGYDFEVMEFFEESFWQYQQDRDTELNYLSLTQQVVDTQKARGGTKKDFVLSVKEALAGLPKECFTMAMFLYDGREEDAKLIAEAKALGEPAQAVRVWLQGRSRAVEDILHAPVLEEV